MKTELVYLSDPGVHMLNATVLEHITLDSAVLYVLDRTPAYPQGGGQPGDRGVLALNGGQDVFFDKTIRTRDGGIGHQCHMSPTTIPPGTNLAVKIDIATRRYHSRLHTAGELICAALANLGHDNWLFSAACHFPGQCRVAFALNGQSVDVERLKGRLSRELALLVISGGIVSLSRASSPEELARLCPSEAAKHFPEWPVRVVSPVRGFYRPCLGTHCDKLSEIGTIKLRKIRVKDGEISIGYELIDV